jgi:hypothetical protein
MEASFLFLGMGYDILLHEDVVVSMQWMSSSGAAPMFPRKVPTPLREMLRARHVPSFRSRSVPAGAYFRTPHVVGVLTPESH